MAAAEERVPATAVKNPSDQRQQPARRFYSVRTALPPAGLRARDPMENRLFYVSMTNRQYREVDEAERNLRYCRPVGRVLDPFSLACSINILTILKTNEGTLVETVTSESFDAAERRAIVLQDGAIEILHGMGQRDGGRTIDSPAGIRPIQTLRKLPTMAPKTKTSITPLRF